MQIIESSDLGPFELASAAQSVAEKYVSENPDSTVVSVGLSRLLVNTGGALHEVPFTMADGPVFGESVPSPIRVYASSEELVLESARLVADSLISGNTEAARNRLQILAEHVTPGGVYTTDALLKRIARNMQASGWEDIFVEKAREIRDLLHGEIGPIKESLPKGRFRVLATEHAPTDLERFRPQVVESMRSVMAAYKALADGLKAIRSASTADYTPIEVSVQESAARSFVDSMVRSTDAVAADGERFIAMEHASGDIAVLARVHDLLADGLEDFSLAAAFAKRLFKS